MPAYQKTRWISVLYVAAHVGAIGWTGRLGRPNFPHFVCPRALQVDPRVVNREVLKLATSEA